jgi:TonB-linked outer membrane protein, SusC/RagA family
MKKSRIRYLLPYFKKNLHAFRIMKLTLLLPLIGITALFASETYSQTAYVTIVANDMETRKIMEEIESQTDYLFVYDPREVNLDRKTSMNVENRPVAEVLSNVFNETNVFYAVEGSNIMLMRRDNSTVNRSQQTNRRITGVITDQYDEAIIGANIIERGTVNGTITDLEGRFALNLTTDNATLDISYIGYITQGVAVNDQTVFNIQLREDAIGLEEVVAIGYGVQRVKEITGAVAQVKAETLSKIGSSDFSQALQGQVAGMSISAASGSPGEGARVQIRGAGSFSSDYISPLYVVDGIPFDYMPKFSSDEIESVEVLKDAASASIYGTRASNGVILITTKQGTPGQMKITFEGYYGVTNVRRSVPLIDNTVDWLWVNRMRYITEENIPGEWKAIESNPTGLHYNTSWMDYVQKDNAPMQNYSLRLSGGGKDVTYNLVTSYFSQDGLWVNSGYERLSTRANTIFKKDRFTAQVGLSFDLSKREQEHQNLPRVAIRLRPFKAPVDADADRIPAPGSNAQAIQLITEYLKRDNSTRGNNGTANLDLSYEIIDGLKIRANIGGNIRNSYNRVFNPSFYLYDVETGENNSNSNPIANLSVENRYNHQWISEFTTTYDKTFGQHKISLLAGLSWEEHSREVWQASKRGFLSNDIRVLDGGAIDPTNGGYVNVTSITGNIGRIQYNYGNRYLFSTSIRRDGSSKFNPDNKYGVFPSASAGWYTSEEPFYQNLGISEIVSNAKIRASIGTTGNQLVPDYEYLALISSGVDYVIGLSDQSLATGATQQSFSNYNVSWETSVSKNLGFDLGFLNNSLMLTADFYYTNKNDMLFPVALPPSAGGGSNASVRMNIGDMINKGTELTATYRSKPLGDFTYQVTGVFMRNVNEVVRTNLPTSTIYGGAAFDSDNTTVIKQGYPVGSFFLIPTDGLINTEAGLAEYRRLVPDAKMGDIKAIDVNNDGVLTDDDRVFMGSGAPKWEGGLTFTGEYKNFDLSMQIHGTYGNKIYNGMKRYAYSHKRHTDLLSAWTPANPTSTIPTPQGNMSHNNYNSRFDYFLEDGSYLRLKNVQVGYNIPRHITERIHLDGFRVYLSVDNVFTFTKYSGVDPELGGDGLMSKGVDNATIPVSSLYRIGFKLDF